MSLKGSSDNAPSSVGRCTYKDIIAADASQTVRVKQEPIETRTPLGPSNSFGPGSPGEEPVRVKAELDELVTKVSYFSLS